MKLGVDFSGLKASADKIGASDRAFSTEGSVKAPGFDIRIELERGIEVELDQVQPNSGGLLAYEGHHVLLYIMDHGTFINGALEDPKKGNRFHVADCSTLETMRREKRFDRYVATNNTSGLFKISGKSSFWGGEEKEGDARLQVCQNCLKKLNYKGFRKITQPEKTKLVGKFELDKFFATYSSYFSQMPSFTTENFPGATYTSDWELISRNYRASKSWCCEKCHVDLSEHTRLLHTHHINGIKSDNTPTNLIALCIDCHSKEPMHAMFVSREDRLQVNALRRQKSESIPSSWREAIELADPAVHGLLDLCRRKNMTVPEVGYEVSDSYCEIFAQVELAWPKYKTAVSIGNEDGIEKMKELGWTVLDVGEAMEEWFG